MGNKNTEVEDVGEEEIGSFAAYVTYLFLIGGVLVLGPLLLMT